MTTLLSGSGGVSKECSETELQGWAEVLQSWPPGGQRPRQLTSLVRAGVPEALRGEVWQRLSGASEKMELTIENYRELVTKESPDEKVIFRDIHRTFPAHEFFKVDFQVINGVMMTIFVLIVQESGGGGQEALYRISKAYSVYDSEIGYCQGQSFLIAALLLQMPEEQAFGVLVEIMFEYGLRDLYRLLHLLTNLTESKFHVPTVPQSQFEMGSAVHIMLNTVSLIQNLKCLVQMPKQSLRIMTQNCH